MKITHRRDYAEARRGAYPPVGDQLDVIWKALSTLPVSPETRAMLEAVQAVKRTFPKS